jgi:multidrug resistance efflux pump
MPEDDHSNDSPQAKSESKSRRIPAPVITVVILIVAAGIFLLVHGNWNTWQSDRADQSTDDAYVRADVTALSTKATSTPGSWLLPFAMTTTRHNRMPPRQL